MEAQVYIGSDRIQLGLELVFRAGIERTQVWMCGRLRKRSNVQFRIATCLKQQGGFRRTRGWPQRCFHPMRCRDGDRRNFLSVDV